MVYRVLSIITSILLSITILLGIVSAVFTLGSAAVRSGFDELSESFQGGVDSIRAAIDDLVSGSDLMSGLASGLGSGFWSGGGSDAGASGAGLGLDDVGSLFGLGSGGQTSAESFADPTQGAAYQAWKDAIDAPMQRVFAGTSIDETMLEGVSGGSRSATDVLTALDETALSTISANATNLRATALANTPSSILPAEAQQNMSAANQSCADFCDQVQELVDQVRSFKAGNLLSAGGLYSAAGEAKAALDEMDAAMVAEIGRAHV